MDKFINYLFLLFDSSQVSLIHNSISFAAISIGTSAMFARKKKHEPDSLTGWQKQTRRWMIPWLKITLMK